MAKSENKSQKIDKNLKSGVENLSGLNLDDVKIHYNSEKPTQIQFEKDIQGRDIHLAPGQEKHLSNHNRIISNLSINNDSALEHEADILGKKSTK